MFKRTISVRSPREVQQQLALLEWNLDCSNLPASTTAYLKEQVGLTLDQFGQHYRSSGITSYNADRVFEGDGFRIVVKIRGRPPGLLGRIKKAIGLG